MASVKPGRLQRQIELLGQRVPSGWELWAGVRRSWPGLPHLCADSLGGNRVIQIEQHNFQRGLDGPFHAWPPTRVLTLMELSITKRDSRQEALMGWT